MTNEEKKIRLIECEGTHVNCSESSTLNILNLISLERIKRTPLFLVVMHVNESIDGSQHLLWSNTKKKKTREEEERREKIAMRQRSATTTNIRSFLYVC